MTDYDALRHLTNYIIWKAVSKMLLLVGGAFLIYSVITGGSILLGEPLPVLGGIFTITGWIIHFILRGVFEEKAKELSTR